MSQGLLNAIERTPRNKLLNPDNFYDQRNSGAAITPAAGAAFPTDRHAFSSSLASKLTFQQYSVALGSQQVTNNSLKLSVAAQATPAAGDWQYIGQFIEGNRMRDLLWGSSFARPMVYTIQGSWPVVGDYSFAVRNGAANRCYVTKFTVSQANTLETHTLVIPGDTTGTWPTDNTCHTAVELSLGTGANFTTATLNQWQAGNYIKASGTIDLVSQVNGSAIYIAWEQYERDMRTDFILPDYDDELRHCQRYYRTLKVNISAYATAGTQNFGSQNTYADMRATPTPSVIAVGVGQNVSAHALYNVDQNSFKYEVTASAAGQLYWDGRVYSLSAEL